MSKQTPGLLEAELVATGDELMSGAISDSNGAYACARLREAGVKVKRMSVVGDGQGEIHNAIAEAASRATIVIVCGGLGPTEDDRTAAAAAQVAGVPLMRHPEALAHVTAMFQRFKVPMTPNNQKQADLPQGCELLDNPIGTAVGFCVLTGVAKVYYLPGVPVEYRTMLDEQVIPRLAALSRVPLATRVIKVYGIGESQLETDLAGLALAPEIELGFRATFPELHIRLYAQGAADLASLLDQAEAAIRARVGDRVFATGDMSLAGAVGELFRARGWKLAVAESCTGGLLGAAITAEPGSSEFFERGWVTYSNQAKTADLGVAQALLEAHGAVSEAVARAMAEGARTRSGAQVALAVTGVAGPGGGTPEKPVGLVWIAAASASGTTAKAHNFRGDRERVRRASVWAALDMARRLITPA